MKMLQFILLFATAPLLAQDYAITGNHGVITAVPLQTEPEVRRSDLPWRQLEMIEDAFINGTQSLDVLVRWINRLPSGGSFEWIQQNGFDPSQLNSPKLRAKFAPVIEAIAYDTRLQTLIDDVNAAISEEEKLKQQTALAKSWQDAVEESRIRARTLYPDIYFPDSRLSKKWVEVQAQMQRDGTLPKTADAFFIITVRAANLLGIPPVSP